MLVTKAKSLAALLCGMGSNLTLVLASSMSGVTGRWGGGLTPKLLFVLKGSKHIGAILPFEMNQLCIVHIVLSLFHSSGFYQTRKGQREKGRTEKGGASSMLTKLTISKAEHCCCTHRL